MRCSHGTLGQTRRTPISRPAGSYKTASRIIPYYPPMVPRAAAERYPTGFEPRILAYAVQRALQTQRPAPRRLSRSTWPSSASRPDRALRMGRYRQQSATQAGEHQMARFGWAADNAPDNFFNNLLALRVRAGRLGGICEWCDKDFEAPDPAGQNHLRPGRSPAKLDSSAGSSTTMFVAADRPFRGPNQPIRPILLKLCPSPRSAGPKILPRLSISRKYPPQ